MTTGLADVVEMMTRTDLEGEEAMMIKKDLEGEEVMTIDLAGGEVIEMMIVLGETVHLTDDQNRYVIFRKLLFNL